jgi:sugar lactone lactonase YvrE
MRTWLAARGPPISTGDRQRLIWRDTEYGNSEVTGHGPDQLGWSIDWLPDGRLLVTGPELMRQEPDGSMVRHADLTGVASHGWNEIVVDGRGNIYLNGFGFDFLGGGKPTPGIIALVTPDNSTLIISESFAGRLTAFDIAADGSLSNRRVWADGLGPDGICLDAEGAIWVQTADTFAHSGRDGAPQGAVVRIRPGGEAQMRIEHDRAIFAAVLGGPDGTTLFGLEQQRNDQWR